MCRIHSASRGRCAISPDRPTQGWTVGEYILLCKVSKLHPPSSLGLDGDGQILSRFEYMQEVPQGAYISLFINCLPCTAYRLSSAKGDGEPSLNWMLSPQGYSTSWMKKCLGLWLTNLKGRLTPHPLIRFLLSGSIPGEKGRSCHIPSPHGRWSQCRQPLSEA